MSSVKHKSKKASLNSPESDEDSEHELFHYANDRIKLMKEVLKLIKPKKIKSIAPDFLKDLDIDEINSILLEELLGISNKRLRHILNGENIDIDTSSSESEQEQKPIDVISLDDISDTDDEFGLGSVNSNPINDIKQKRKQKPCKKLKEVKKEKGEQHLRKESQPAAKVNNVVECDKLMNVLEILELQARARAIRSQLALENINKKTENVDKTEIIEDDDDIDAVIVHNPINEEIIISESDDDDKEQIRTKIQTIENSIEDISHASENTTQKDDEVNQVVHDDEKIETINEDNKTQEKSLSNETSKESPIHKTSHDATQNDVSNEMKSSDSNNSLQIDTDSTDDRNNLIYKSDSDNDVINLDSEDIENV